MFSFDGGGVSMEFSMYLHHLILLLINVFSLNYVSHVLFLILLRFIHGFIMRRCEIFCRSFEIWRVDP